MSCAQSLLLAYNPVRVWTWVYFEDIQFMPSIIDVCWDQSFFHYLGTTNSPGTTFYLMHPRMSRRSNNLHPSFWLREYQLDLRMWLTAFRSSVVITKLSLNLAYRRPEPFLEARTNSYIIIHLIPAFGLCPACTPIKLNFTLGPSWKVYTCIKVTKKR